MSKKSVSAFVLVEEIDDAVEFTGTAEYRDEGYGSVEGVCGKHEKWCWVCDENPTYNKSLYTPDQQKIIDKFIEDNGQMIGEELEKEAEKKHL